ELGVEHVEAQLARPRGVAPRGNELERRVLVDELPDEPGACDPVDVDALPGDPGMRSGVGDAERARRRHDRSRSGRRDALPAARDETLDGLTPGRAEEIDLRHGRQPLAKL